MKVRVVITDDVTRCLGALVVWGIWAVLCWWTAIEGATQ